MQINMRITEVLSRVITVDASSPVEAKEFVADMYYHGDIVLDERDFDGNTIIEEKIDNFNSKKDLLINEIINYLIYDEEKHYEEFGKPSEHIYLKLLELQKQI